MRENISVKVINGITFLDLLTILFITLKLTNFIDWSWLWVLSPIWIYTALAILTVAVREK